MDSPAPALLASAPLLLLALAVTAGLVAVASHWFRQRTAALATMHRAPAGKIVYNDAPTVRVSDAQRVDRIRKVVRLRAGELVDVLETPAALPPRLRVTLKAVTQRDGCELARLHVEFGGTQISCGPQVTELGPNEFEVPRAGRDEARSALFHYHENGSALDFMRIKVRALDIPNATAELDIMQVSGHWPASH